MRTRVALLVLLAMLAASGGVAQATTVVAEGTGFMWQPDLGGERVYFMRYGRSPDTGRIELQVQSAPVAGGPASTFVGIAPRGSERCATGGKVALCGLTPTSVSADANGIAVGIWGVISGVGPFGPFAIPRSFELFAGPNTARPSKRYECQFGDRPGFTIAPPPALAGGVAVGAGRECADNRVTLVDAASGAVRAELPAGGGRVWDVAAAPGFVAFTASNDRTRKTALTVVDVAGGTVAYRVSFPRAPDGIAVQSDGTAIATMSKRGRSPGCSETSGVTFTASWFSPTRRAPRTLPFRLCKPWVRLAGGRAALMHSPRRGRQQLALVNLADNSARPIAEFDTSGAPLFKRFADQFSGFYEGGTVFVDYARTAGRLFDGLLLSRPGPFDWDGARVAYRDMGCAGMRIVIVDPAVDPPAEPTRCPVTVGTPRYSPGTRLVTIALTCPAGCAGTLGPIGDQVLSDLPSYREFTIPAAQTSGTVSFRLTPADARILKRRKRAPLDLVVAAANTTTRVTKTVAAS